MTDQQKDRLTDVRLEIWIGALQTPSFRWANGHDESEMLSALLEIQSHRASDTSPGGKEEALP